jgi:uncharacterized caspase-like protein
MPVIVLAHDRHTRNGTMRENVPNGWMPRSVAGLLAAAALVTTGDSAAAAQSMQRQDLEIVDCLLPPQIRQVGGRTFATPRRPTRTTQTECRVRGGEWVSYDRAKLETALAIWQEAADAGDPEAQTVVGEIYEKGLGTAPDYARAASWYRKAADQGHARAQFNLGTLYEQGLGVGKDALQALNLYRAAGGLEGDVGYEEAYRQELERQRAELTQAIAERDRQIEALEQQVEELERRIEQQGDAAAELSRQIGSLKGLLEQLRREREGSQARLTSLPPARTREPSVAGPPTTSDGSADASPRELAGLTLGRYYALVIGNQNYRRIEPLATPIADAQRAARVLKDRYGFEVTVVDDADDVAMLRALNDLNGVLKPEDNLLVYYAGHGTRLRTADRETGYWLPINADPPPTDTFWVANEQVTGHLARLPARRVLVVADSCYAGLLSDDPSFLLRHDASGASLDYVRIRLPKRARLLIASGGDQPVLDTGGEGNSVFARAFLDALEANGDVLSAPALFARLQDRVKAAAARTGFRQVPEFKAIKGAGHEIGDFFFVPVRAQP